MFILCCCHFPKRWHQGLLLVLLILVSWVLVAHAVGEFLDRMVRLEIKNEKAETQHAPRKNKKQPFFPLHFIAHRIHVTSINMLPAFS